MNAFWEKVYFQVPDTGSQVLDNTRPYLCSGIVSFWKTPARSKECKYHIFRQYWYTNKVLVFTNTGTFQYLGPEVYFFRILYLHYNRGKFSGNFLNFRKFCPVQKNRSVYISRKFSSISGNFDNIDFHLSSKLKRKKKKEKKRKEKKEKKKEEEEEKKHTHKTYKMAA